MFIYQIVLKFQRGFGVETKLILCIGENALDEAGEIIARHVKETEAEGWTFMEEATSSLERRWSKDLD